jgi:hypothetical protein
MAAPESLTGIILQDAGIFILRDYRSVGENCPNLPEGLQGRKKVGYYGIMRFKL